MKKPVLIAIIAIALALAIGITVYAATKSAAGSSDDPLVSKSYVDGEYSQQIIKNASTPIESKLRPVYDVAMSAAKKADAAADNTARSTVAKGGSVTLGEGACLTMLSGQADISVGSGTVSDVTAGAAAKNGPLTANHRYIVCTGGSAAVTVTGKAAFITSGAAAVSGELKPLAFKDVKTSDWFYEYVASSVETGLIDGTTAVTYSPYATLTLAQSIKLAACMHQLYTDKKVTLTNDKDIWYMSYVKYAVSEGIIDGGYAGKSTKEYNAPVTRSEFDHIFYGALPQSQYAEINSVKDNSIPDVKLSADYGDEIYAFYRAGILTGDSTHKFNPADSIKRSEVAAITARMMDSSLRQSVTLG